MCRTTGVACTAQGGWVQTGGQWVWRTQGLRWRADTGGPSLLLCQPWFTLRPGEVGHHRPQTRGPRAFASALQAVCFGTRAFQVLSLCHFYLINGDVETHVRAVVQMSRSVTGPEPHRTRNGYTISPCCVQPELRPGGGGGVELCGGSQRPWAPSPSSPHTVQILLCCLSLSFPSLGPGVRPAGPLRSHPALTHSGPCLEKEGVSCSWMGLTLVGGWSEALWLWTSSLVRPHPELQ